jgi:hypothetical protein
MWQSNINAVSHIEEGTKPLHVLAHILSELKLSREALSHEGLRAVCRKKEKTAGEAGPSSDRFVRFVIWKAPTLYDTR